MNTPAKPSITRRQTLGLLAAGAGVLAAPPAVTLLAQTTPNSIIAVDPTPRFENATANSTTR